MTASRVCFILAWVVCILYIRGVYSPKRTPRQFWSWSVCSTIFLFLLVLWTQPDAVPGYSGILIPRGHLLFSSTGGGTLPRLEIGDSGTIFIYGGPQEQPLFRFLKKSSLTIETIDDRVQVSTTLFNRSGKPVAELTRNEWQVSPPPNTWDRNYTDDTLEVKDDRSRIVLQVRALPDHIQIQDEW